MKSIFHDQFYFKLGLLGVILLGFIPTIGFSQDPAHYLLTDKDGLPSNEIYGMIQDEKGYIWISTDNGLCRYNGLNFEKFTHPNQRSKATSILKMDKWGKIWVMNFSNQLFVIENGIMEEFIFSDSIELEFKNFFLMDTMLVVPLPIRTIGSMLRFNLVDSSYVFNKYPQGLTGFQYSESKRNPFLIYFEERCYMQTGEGWELIPTDNIPKMYVETGKMGHKSNYLADNILYSKECNDEQPYLLVDKRWKKIPITNWPQGSSQIILDLVNLRDDEYWIIGFDGTASFQANYRLKQELDYVFQDRKISCGIYDAEGNYWFGTLGDGILVVPDFKTKIFRANNGEAHRELMSSDIRSLGTDGENLWIGDEKGGITIWYPEAENRPAKRIRLNKNSYELNDFFWSPKDQKMFVSGQSAYVIENETLLGRVWGGSVKDVFYFKDLILKMDPYSLTAVKFKESGEVDLFHRAKKSKISPFKFGITYDGGNYGLRENWERVWDRSGKSVLSSSLFLRSVRGWSVWVDTFHKKKDDFTIWGAFADKLCYFEADGGFHELPDPKTDQAILGRDIVQCDRGKIWVGTTNQGIYGIRGDTIAFHFSTENILPTNQFLRLKAEGDTLWACGPEGLFKIVPKDSTVEVFNKADGLSSSDVYDIEIWEGYIWLATGKGLQKIPRSAFHPNSIPPPIYIDGIALFERDTLLPPFSKLPYNKNNLRFSFQGLSMKSQGEFTYEYRMIGLDSSWLEVPSTQSVARFPSINPGSYRFEVRALNEDKFYSSETASFPFYILKPWWRRWWFFTLSTIILIGIVATIFWSRLAREKRERAYEKQLDNLRMTALQAQMNPHFIFNALNAIQYYFTENKTENALSYLSKFSRLIRTIFEHAKLNRISLEEEISFLKLYAELEKLRFGDKVAVHWDIDQNLDLGMEIPPLLIQPILENSFKYGLLHKNEKGNLYLKLEDHPHHIAILIEDDGVGRAAASKMRKPRIKGQTSTGLKTIEERTRIYHQEVGWESFKGLTLTDLYSEEGEAKGTRVELVLKKEE
ncbi:MAG: histidine kinase [Bacteroidota bacterium]